MTDPPLPPGQQVPSGGAPAPPSQAPAAPSWGYGATTPPTAPSPGPVAATVPPSRGNGGMAVVAGLLAMLGAVLSVAGTLLPVTTWGDDSQPPFAILPILEGGSEELNEFSWFALEPLGIAVAAVVLGVSLVLGRRPRLTGGGALAAFGITTILAFAAYVLSSVLNETFGEPYGPIPGPGSWLGLASGAVLLAAGMLAVASAPRRTG